MIHITTATTTNLPPSAGLKVTVNAAYTGTITVSDTNGVQAIITNPAVGASFNYFGFVGPTNIVTSAIGDITVSILSAARA